MTEPNHMPAWRARLEPLDSYPKVAEVIRRELWRHELDKMHLRVASVILELSYGSARESVKIDRLKVLCDLTGIDRAHVSRALEALRRMRILNSKVVDRELMELQLEPDADKWRCQPLQTEERLADALDWIEMLNRPVVSEQPLPVVQPLMEVPAGWNQ